MKILNLVKGTVIILFFVILAGAYLKLFDNYDFTESFTLFDMRYVFGGAYFLIRLGEYIFKKRN